MGKLTRDLHIAINNFSDDSRIADMTEHAIPDSRARLDYVVTLTEQAAHQTLEAVDKAIPATALLVGLTQTTENTLQSNANNTCDTSEHRLNNYFSSIKQQTSIIQCALSDITMAQGFQDLTGQVIKKVIDLIEEVETNLVKLIKIAAEHQPNTKPKSLAKKINPIEAEGPQINAADKSNVITDQNDVDDLLSSLGF